MKRMNFESLTFKPEENLVCPMKGRKWKEGRKK